MFCKNCGEKIADGVKFCPSCGTGLDKKNATPVTAVYSDSISSFDFHTWIQENGLEAYEELLKNQELDSEDVLVGLTPDDFAKLDIESLGGQKKIQNAIQKLRSYNRTNSYNTSKEQVTDVSTDIPNRCPRCGEIWGKDKENSGAGNTLGKALIGGLLLGPIGAVGGAAFGNKTVVYQCRKCGFRKEYKSSLVKGAAKGIKDMFKTV